MAYDLFLQERIELSLNKRKTPFEAKKMMGGLCYMIDDKMCIGIVKNELMARIDPEKFDELLKQKGARIMDFTKKPMKGFIFISPEGIDMDSDLEFWIAECLEFNPKAKSSKKK